MPVHQPTDGILFDRNQLFNSTKQGDGKTKACRVSRVSDCNKQCGQAFAPSHFHFDVLFERSCMD